jgi:hypothetical protein
VALQVQAAWLRPNLLRLLHVWLGQAKDADTTAAHLLEMANAWVTAQLAPAMHPAAVQRGLAGPAVAAAVAALGSARSKEVQVSYGWGCFRQVSDTCCGHRRVDVAVTHATSICIAARWHQPVPAAEAIVAA